MAGGLLAAKINNEDGIPWNGREGYCLRRVWVYLRSYRVNSWRIKH
jgi:hypothetical protein